MPRETEDKAAPSAAHSGRVRLRGRGLRIDRRILLRAAVVSALAGATWIGVRVVQKLRAHPVHTVRFDAIVLEPSPPPWIRSGTAALLRQVRALANYPEKVAVTSLDLAALRQALSLHAPWIEKVHRIEISHPNQILARVSYREPVAWVEVSESSAAKVATEPRQTQPREYLVDRHGTLLPTEDLDISTAGWLITITTTNTNQAWEISAPLDSHPGQPWLVRDPRDGSTRTSEAIVKSARFAAFLRSRPAPPSWLKTAIINPTDPAGLFLMIGDNPAVWILWGQSSTENSDGLGDDQKWQRVARFAETRSGQPIPADVDYFIITHSGVEPHRRPSTPVSPG